jgi:uncharacterized BrkB/YihY/UPF0761 family membrane protein
VNSEDARAWEETRDRGALRFVVVAGLLRVGLGFWALFASLDYLTRYGFTLIDPAPQAIAWHFARWVPGALVVGLIFAACYWVVMSKQYMAYRREQQPK